MDVRGQPHPGCLISGKRDPGTYWIVSRMRPSSLWEQNVDRPACIPSLYRLSHSDSKPYLYKEEGGDGWASGQEDAQAKHHVAQRSRAGSVSKCPDAQMDTLNLSNIFCKHALANVPGVICHRNLTYCHEISPGSAPMLILFCYLRSRPLSQAFLSELRMP
jgi:hypothetical protein